MIIGLLGKAGSGKDTVASIINKELNTGLQYNWSFAEPMKEFCAKVLHFSDEQLWGPSECRSVPDPRYVRPNGELLTARFALQTLGADWGRNCYEDIWVDYTLRSIFGFDTGVPTKKTRIHVITDCRFLNEARKVSQVGKVVRIIRPSQVPTTTHASETAQDDPAIEQYVSHTIINDGSLDDLREKTKTVLKDLGLL